MSKKISIIQYEQFDDICNILTNGGDEANYSNAINRAVSCVEIYLKDNLPKLTDTEKETIQNLYNNDYTPDKPSKIWDEINSFPSSLQIASQPIRSENILSFMYFARKFWRRKNAKAS